MSAVDVAAQFGHADIIRLLVQEGQADLRGAREGQGFAPLYYAIAHKKMEAVVELLRLGADPLKTDPDMPKRDSLGQAATEGNLEIMKLLLDLPGGGFDYSRLGHALGAAEMNHKDAAVRLLEEAMRDYVIKRLPPPSGPSCDPAI
ncbi:MAG TPA: ankyrin repeat domain-containing protein [Patescibacteria group bacterium]|nr:ankyrin repeat domain-containing protein [Patescibacteria group bacterium]